MSQNKTNGKGSRPRNNDSAAFRDGHDAINWTGKTPLELAVERQKRIWGEDYKERYSWEEFQEFEECEECGWWSDEECMCWTRR